MEIEFDPHKAASNLKKHAVDFDEAATALLDPMALVMDDPDAMGEQRLVLLGMSQLARLLLVCYTFRGELVRLISARRATKHEERAYAQRI